MESNISRKGIGGYTILSTIYGGINILLCIICVKKSEGSIIEVCLQSDWTIYKIKFARTERVLLVTQLISSND